MYYFKYLKFTTLLSKHKFIFGKKTYIYEKKSYIFEKRVINEWENSPKLVIGAALEDERCRAFRETLFPIRFQTRTKDRIFVFPFGPNSLSCFFFQTNWLQSHLKEMCVNILNLYKCVSISHLLPLFFSQRTLKWAWGQLFGQKESG